MSNQPTPAPTPAPEPKPKAWTARQVMEQIPHEWQDATIACSDGLGRYYNVKRVALHRNRSGKKIIVLHTNEALTLEAMP